MNKIRFIGLDVHADTIAVAVAEPGGEVRSLVPLHSDRARSRQEKQTTQRGRRPVAG